MTFELEFSEGAYSYAELSDLLKKAAQHVEELFTSGLLTDSHGTVVGSWKVTE
jgi:hypothetical protein